MPAHANGARIRQDVRVDARPINGRPTPSFAHATAVRVKQFASPVALAISPAASPDAATIFMPLRGLIDPEARAPFRP